MAEKWHTFYVLLHVTMHLTRQLSKRKLPGELCSHSQTVRCRWHSPCWYNLACTARMRGAFDVGFPLRHSLNRAISFCILPLFTLNYTPTPADTSSLCIRVIIYFPYRLPWQCCLWRSKVNEGCLPSNVYKRLWFMDY